MKWSWLIIEFLPSPGSETELAGPLTMAEAKEESMLTTQFAYKWIDRRHDVNESRKFAILMSVRKI